MEKCQYAMKMIVATYFFFDNNIIYSVKQNFTG